MNVMHLISDSRKTDIPAFYMEWFMRRIAEGQAYVYNASRNEAKAVSLVSDHVGAIVFWSKNYRPALPYLNRLRKMGYRLFFITPLRVSRGGRKNMSPPRFKTFR